MALVFLVMLGCAGSEPATSTAKPAPRPGPSVALRVLVVNEPELAASINRLRGEWTEYADGDLTAESADWASWSAADSIAADAILFPSRYLGTLCTRGWLRPVRPNVLESKEFAADDFFPLVRRQIIRWGGQVMAVPLGAHFVTTANEKNAPPALRLFARAAPRVATREQLGVLFDPQTMKPRIAEPGFVAALTELIDSNKAEDDSALEPQQPITGASAQGRAGDVSQALVPVIGYVDRLAAVTSSSRNAASAFKLLEWLARPEISSQVARAGTRPLPVRRSLATSAKWHDPSLPEAERALVAKALADALSSEQWLMVPRLPGVDKYIAALESEIKAASDGRVTPQAALENAARSWERITEAHGRQKQREAYLQHLRIAD